MLNPDSVGRTYKGANPVTVTQEEISTFAQAIGEEDLSVAAPTFSIRISLAESQAILSTPEVGIAWDRLVHGEQKFELRRPIVAGDVLTCDSTIENYKVVAGNEILTVRSELASEGKLVASSWSTLVVRA